MVMFHSYVSLPEGIGLIHGILVCFLWVMPSKWIIQEGAGNVGFGLCQIYGRCDGNGEPAESIR
jgi:hypothetical protein